MKCDVRDGWCGRVEVGPPVDFMSKILYGSKRRVNGKIC